MHQFKHSRLCKLVPGGLILLLPLVLSLTTGCASSASVTSSASSSKIISSPFKSSSKSSGGDEDSEYPEEVKSYTAAYLETEDQNSNNFQSGLSDLAASNGISDWEANSATWISVGQGLAEANLEQEAAQAYAQSWSGGNPDILALIMQGYPQ